MRQFNLMLLICLLFMNFRVVKVVPLTGNKNYEQEHQDDEDNKDKKKEKTKVLLKLIKQNPENNCSNFNGKKITLTFSRKIEFNKKKVHITPNLDDWNGIFKFNVSGDKLIIKIVKKLDEDITYQINLTDALQDYDGNKSENVVVIFTPGEKLCDCNLSGTIRNLMTNTPVSNGIVALYRDVRTYKIIEGDETRIFPAHILNDPNPDYFTKIDEKGNYKIEHISNGKYFVCAGEVTGEKLLSDCRKNKYGFVAESIEFKDNSITKDFEILEANSEKFKVTETKSEGKDFFITFNKPIRNNDYGIKLLIKSTKFEEALTNVKISEDRKSLIFDYNDFIGMLPNKDKIPCEVTATDENNETVKTKVNIRFGFVEANQDENEIKETKKQKEITFEHVDKNVTVKSLINFKINFPRNIARVDKDKIKLFFQTKLDKKIELDSDLFDVEIIENKYVIVKSQKIVEDITNEYVKKFEDVSREVAQLVYEDIKLNMVLQQGAIVFSDRTSNEEISKTFTFSKRFGSIGGEVYIDDNHFKIQLLDEKYNVVADQKDVPSFNFENIQEGKYWIRILIWDKNKFQWDFGDINYKKEHDPVFFYKDQIEVIQNSKIENIKIQCKKDNTTHENEKM